jgi:hypothetical protein
MRKLSVNTWGYTLIIIEFIFIFIALLWNYNFVWVVLISFLLLILFHFTTRKPKWKLPSKCKYNPFSNRIEFHVNSNPNMLSIAKSLIKTILIANEKGVDVEFYSGHYTKTRFIRTFLSTLKLTNNDFNIDTPSGMEKWEARTVKTYYKINKVQNTGEVLKISIYASKLSDNQIRTLEQI